MKQLNYSQIKKLQKTYNVGKDAANDKRWHLLENGRFNGQVCNGMP